MDWISVTDRLPDYGRDVLLLFEPGGFFRQRYVIGCRTWEDLRAERGDWWPSRARKFRVTHWMPLPLPPDHDHEADEYATAIMALARPESPQPS